MESKEYQDPDPSVTDVEGGSNDKSPEALQAEKREHKTEFTFVVLSYLERPSTHLTQSPGMPRPPRCFRCYVLLSRLRERIRCLRGVLSNKSPIE